MLNLPYSPPTKKTVLLSLFVLLIGIGIGIMELADGGISASWGLTSMQVMYIAFGLCFLSWIIMMIGVLFRGV